MTPFNSRLTVASLILVNAALLGAVVLSSSPKAQAAFGAEGHISLVVGQSIGSVPEMVYLVDVDSGKAAAVAFSLATRKLETYGIRDLSKDLNDKNGRTPDR